MGGGRVDVMQDSVDADEQVKRLMARRWMEITS